MHDKEKHHILTQKKLKPASVNDWNDSLVIRIVTDTFSVTCLIVSALETEWKSISELITRQNVNKDFGL